MRRPQGGAPRDHEGDGTWHARDVTTSSSASSAVVAAVTLHDGPAAAEHEGSGPGFAATRRLLARVGVGTPFGRDVVLAAFAVAWRLLSPSVSF